MVHLTDHSVEKAKERLNINRKSLQRIADKAFEHGLTHSEVKGSLSRYMDRLWFRGSKAGNMRIFGEHIFLFAGNALITIFEIPNKYKNYVREAKNKNE